MVRLRWRAVATVLGVAAFLVVGSGCGDRGRPDDRGEGGIPPESTAAPAASPAPAAPGEARMPLGGPEGLLRLAEDLPPGSSLTRARARLPGLGRVRPEGGLAGGPGPPLTEAFLEVSALDRRGRLELNFRRDTLYGLFVALDSLDCATADSLYGALVEAYSERLGRAEEETAREPGYRSRSAFWRGTHRSIAATLGRQAGACRLSWGYQEPEGRG